MLKILSRTRNRQLETRSMNGYGFLCSCIICKKEKINDAKIKDNLAIFCLELICTLKHFNPFIKLYPNLEYLRKF